MTRPRLRTLLVIALVAAAGIFLFHISQRVQKSQQALDAVSARVAAEEETLRVLRAEWDYLNNPERLELLATKYLGMAAPAPAQILPDVSQIPAFDRIGADDRAALQPAAVEEEAP